MTNETVASSSLTPDDYGAACGSGEKWQLTIFHRPPCLTKTKVVRPWIVCTLLSLVTPSEGVIGIHNVHVVVKNAIGERFLAQVVQPDGILP